MLHRTTTALASLLLAAGLTSAQELNKISAVEAAQGFSLLYDGTLASFKANFVDYIKGNATNTNLSAEWTVATDGSGAIGTQARTEDVRSKKLYKDFDLRMEYRCDANQGIFYRHLLTTDRSWQTGIEVAINNYTNENKDAPGAAYDLFPPHPNTYNLYSTTNIKWNQLRIVVKADSIEHWMNGTKVVGFKLWSPAFWSAYAVSKWNAAQTLTYKTPNNKAAGYITEGYLGLQADHGGKWSIRNFRISESPCPGPVNNTRMSTDCNSTALPGDAAVTLEGWLKGAALLREGQGATLDLGAPARPGTVTMSSLDGRSWTARIQEGTRRVGFSGAFRPGVYLVRLRTEAGESSRKIRFF